MEESGIYFLILLIQQLIYFKWIKGWWPGSEPQWTRLVPEKKKKTNAVTNLHHVYYCYVSCATFCNQQIKQS